MVHTPSKLEENFNKLANTAKFAGLLTLTMVMGVFIGLSQGGLLEEAFLLAVLLGLGAFGLSAILFGELSWRLILKYGSSERRLFYFYNHDRKRFE